MSSKRDNSYYRSRLHQMHRDDLIEMVDNDDISMYRACLAAGIRKKKPKALVEGFDRAWQRLSRKDKQKFVIANRNEIAAIMNLITEAKAQAKKTSQ